MKIQCGACGTDSDHLFCYQCYEIMINWKKVEAIPAICCIFCDYPEPFWKWEADKYCRSCGIRQDVELIKVKPKKKKRRRRIPTTATSNIDSFTITEDLTTSDTTPFVDNLTAVLYHDGITGGSSIIAAASA
ncbi:MAG: hypothetical protein KJI71_01350 [Patescibacteria group bacterium]|nr:hypothetical protein [Patescibacteria group bacterium]